MHMFVEKDTGYQQMYFNYQGRDNPEDVCLWEESKEELDTQTSVSERDIEDINVSMVSSLLGEE